jgi:hypothetical protein
MQRIASFIASIVRLPFLRTPACLAAALLLNACAAPMQAGQDASQVLAARGAPSTKAKTAAGERWIYASTFAQFNTTVEFDAAGKVIRAYNGLTDTNFATIETGKWTRDEVMAAFGPPAEKGRVGWGAHTFDVWSYRYKQNGQADMLMNVHFGSDGKVAKFYPTIDPYFDPGGNEKTSLLRLQTR